VQGDGNARTLTARAAAAAHCTTNILLRGRRRRSGDHYVYALTDYREVDKSIALARIA
jgi:hypothetical protein